MDPKTDSDFLKLASEVHEGFKESADRHKDLMGKFRTQQFKIEQNERAIVELREGNVMMRKVLFGNGGVGSIESQRVTASFLKGFKKVLWIAATVVTAAMVTGIFAIARHIVTGD